MTVSNEKKKWRVEGRSLLPDPSSTDTEVGSNRTRRGYDNTVAHDDTGSAAVSDTTVLVLSSIDSLYGIIFL